MKHHKNNALEKKCLCEKCELRFTCFTQERIFTDPLYQGLYEALIAKGRTKDEALDEVMMEIKFAMNKPTYPISGGKTYDDNDIYISPYPGTTTPETTWAPSIWISGGDIYGSAISNGNVNADLDGSDLKITYTLATGEKVSWSANACEFNKVR